MLRRFAPALAAATLLLAACGGAGTTVADPEEIMTQGLEATAELESFHLAVEVEGTASIPDLGGQMSLDGTSLEGDFDLPGEKAHMTFAVPAMFGLTGEVIQDGTDSYVKTTMTGEKWMKSTIPADEPETEAMDPGQVIEEVRGFLDEEGVELEKLDDVDCGDGTCYAVRLTIPAELLSEAGEGTDVPGDVLTEPLVVDLLFDREEMWLTEASTQISSEEVGELTLRLTLSDFNEEVDVQVPPEDQVTEDGGEGVFPF